MTAGCFWPRAEIDQEVAGMTAPENAGVAAETYFSSWEKFLPREEFLESTLSFANSRLPREATGRFNLLSRRSPGIARIVA